MNNSNIDKFEILSRLAKAGSSGKDLREVSDSALSLAAEYVGLTAAALHLWNEKNELILSVDHAKADSARKRLAGLENDLFRSLRNNSGLSSAYMSFDGQPPTHAFTLPLKFRGRTFGALIGLQEGEKTVVAEDDLLESLTSLLALNFAVDNYGQDSVATEELVSKGRREAIVETAVTVNHEINNPLTAILGNIQLLLLKGDELDPSLVQKLRVVEQSALKIRDVTQRLLKLTTPKSVTYTDGTNMIDLSDGKDEGSE